ncbi:hypothetical protein MRX96_049946 [Rhipicephalus microplus]
MTIIINAVIVVVHRVARRFRVFTFFLNCSRCTRAGYPRSRELPRAIGSEPSSPIKDLKTVAIKRSFDKTSGGTTLRNRSLVITNHQEWIATQLGPAPGGSHVLDRRPLPRLAWPAILQPSINLLEHHCCQGQYFHSI